MTAKRWRDDQTWKSQYHNPTSLAHPELSFRRSLKDIETRSLALSKKKLRTRLIDKTRDSQQVVKLVEQLRQAILVYQVGLAAVKVWQR